MAKNPKEGKLLYHLTSIDNLPRIIEEGLKPRISLSNFVDIADVEIIEHRMEYKLDKYIPFHFFASTPFAGAVQQNNSGKKFVYLTINRGLAEYNNFKIIPKHPLTFKQEPVGYKEGLEQIDWELMAKRDYSDHDCKEVCMAECITEKNIPFKHIRFIYVKDDSDYGIVKQLVAKAGALHEQFSIFVNNGMFKK